MSDVKFVRIRGRIVPIRKKQADGIKAIGAASVIAGGGGYIAGRLLRKADRAHQLAFDFGMKNPDTMDNMIKTLKGLNSAHRVKQVAKGISIASRFAATGLGAVGLHSLLRNEKDSATKDAAKLAGAAGVSELASRGLYAGFKKKIPFSMKVSPKLKTAGLDLLKKVVKAKL
jgi:hypothetical protein